MNPFVGELLGTMILILLGDGVVAAVVLEKTKAHAAGWIVITVGWGLAVMCGIFVSQALGGPGSLNPAGMVAGMVLQGQVQSSAIALIGAQFLGAFLGAVLVWLFYWPHWSVTRDQGSKLAVFCTGPAIPHLPSNLLGEAIGTFVLVFVATAMKKEGTPYIVGMLIWSIGLSLGATTGYAINPARDLAPRLAHALLPIPGKGGSNWGYAPVPIVGPILGAISAAILWLSVSG